MVVGLIISAVSAYHH